jgi:hypothetical protein
MRTHCKEGHQVQPSGRCRICDNATRQQRKAKLYGDGLTPLERGRRGRYKFVDGRRKEAA